nr:MAG TPA: DNA repair protein MmcB-like protein [Caudoviricetes sp.]
MTQKRIHHDMCVEVAKLLKKGVKAAGIPPMSLRAVELSDITTGTYEAPDVIAYRQNVKDSICMVFEIKVSRADFKADSKKRCRGHAEGMGVQRYFVVPYGLVSPEEVREGWGLLYLSNGSLTTIKKSNIFSDDERNLFGEVNTLLNLMRRGARWGEIFDNDDYRLE